MKSEVLGESLQEALQRDNRSVLFLVLLGQQGNSFVPSVFPPGCVTARASQSWAEIPHRTSQSIPSSA